MPGADGITAVRNKCRTKIAYSHTKPSGPVRKYE